MFWKHSLGVGVFGLFSGSGAEYNLEVLKGLDSSVASPGMMISELPWSSVCFSPNLSFPSHF